MADTERLCDLANTASHLASMSNRLDDHAAAAKSHRAAFEAIRKEDRPSLAQTHLEQAARHDKIATDADSYEQKEVLARGASKKADRDNAGDSHEKAASAHKAAAAAYRAQRKGGKNPDDWQVRNHDDSARRHEEKAVYLKKIDAGE